MNFIKLFANAGRLRHPVVYFAGRMNMCAECHSDWRYHIIDSEMLPDGMMGPIDPRTIVDFGSFRYGGPFLTDNTGGHAKGHCGYDSERRRVFDVDLAQIARADLFVAYIRDLECFGTLTEIGFAHGLGKPIALGFATDMPRRDFEELWFPRMAAVRVYRGSPREFWRQVMADFIAPEDWA